MSSTSSFPTNKFKIKNEKEKEDEEEQEKSNIPTSDAICPYIVVRHDRSPLPEAKRRGIYDAMAQERVLDRGCADCWDLICRQGQGRLVDRNTASLGPRRDGTGGAGEENLLMTMWMETLTETDDLTENDENDETDENDIKIEIMDDIEIVKVVTVNARSATPSSSNHPGPRGAEPRPLRPIVSIIAGRSASTSTPTPPPPSSTSSTSSFTAASTPPSMLRSSQAGGDSDSDIDIDGDGDGDGEVEVTGESSRRIPPGANHFSRASRFGSDSPFSGRSSARDAIRKHDAAIDASLADQLGRAKSRASRIGEASTSTEYFAQGTLMPTGSGSVGTYASAATRPTGPRATQNQPPNRCELTAVHGESSNGSAGWIGRPEDPEQGRDSTVHQHVRDAFYSLRIAVRRQTHPQNNAIRHESDDGDDDGNGKKPMKEEAEDEREMVAGVRDGSYQRAVRSFFQVEKDVLIAPAPPWRSLSLLGQDQELEMLREDVRRLRDEKAALMDRVVALLEEKAAQARREGELMRRMEERDQYLE
ncbi:hypothetical protein A1O3_05561 [Capronia epimyces CBS 606.96]|uniref:Uncharacterized protein n=1 Tax=Capronia epimyces CBS 606.96 TaxID=1182542 RepID=W9Y6Q0_9EURO|nr:uncharacterized protein A1O3_05561 [Capronia epimyces CBS 606.96]EXJ84886.1 hypothetical protein A1O3_05561 [Capronia epimyces CBS 606.96]